MRLHARRERPIERLYHLLQSFFFFFYYCLLLLLFILFLILLSVCAWPHIFHSLIQFLYFLCQHTAEILKKAPWVYTQIYVIPRSNSSQARSVTCIFLFFLRVKQEFLGEMPYYLLHRRAVDADAFDIKSSNDNILHIITNRHSLFFLRDPIGPLNASATQNVLNNPVSSPPK